jgi:hypothetical protein
MLKSVANHLIVNVIPAARDYGDAEAMLSAAFAAVNEDQSKCHGECETAKRRAAEVAVALDGLADRAALDLGGTPNSVRAQVAPLCAIGGTVRDGCVDRVCAVANAYKHYTLNDPKHLIRSDADVLVVGAGFGIDGYGLGKWGGIEVMVHQTDGQKRKFSADVPYTIAGWFEFLKRQGALLPHEVITVCGLTVR